MAILHTALFGLALVGLPALMIFAAARVRFLGWLGPVMLCYGGGIVLANVPGVALPDLSRTAMEISVPLAIPLLLFPTHFPSWMRLAKRTVIAFVLALVSVLIVTTASAFVFSVPGEESWKVSGMLVGVYTGGTPNMSAIGWALEVQEETFLLLNIVDMLWGALYFLFLVTVAQRVMRLFLPRFPERRGEEQDDAEAVEVEDMSLLRRLRAWPRIGAALGLSVLVLGLTAGASMLILGQIHEAFVIIGISTLGIGLSFVGPVRRLRGSYELGQYLVMVFCVAIGSTAELSQLLTAGLPYMVYVGVVMFGALALHIGLCALFRIDTDTTIITGTAAIYGPAFIGAVAGALRNREVVVSGITAGLVGIALGNYLGLVLAYGLRWLMGG